MKLIDAGKLTDLAAALVQAGYRVIAPLRVGGDRAGGPAGSPGHSGGPAGSPGHSGGPAGSQQPSGAPAGSPGAVRLTDWTAGAAIELSEFPVNSAKDFLFVPSELIGRYAFEGDSFRQQEVEPGAEGSQPTVILGVRPCEAAALAVMDAVFNWDCADEFYNARRRATTIVAVACTSADENCFCTSVGGAPDSTVGADAILRPTRAGRAGGPAGSQGLAGGPAGSETPPGGPAGLHARFFLEPLSDKGHKIIETGRPILVDGDDAPAAAAEVPVRFNSKTVGDWLRGNFESPRWRELSLACLGCAACAYGCPTCHCFDIQDEATRAGGVRYRNWDACGLALFTLHTSGHNPRPDQSARWRQRVMHKFSHYPDKFGLLACTGCGRCARICPAGVAMLETLRAIEKLK